MLMSWETCLEVDGVVYSAEVYKILMARMCSSTDEVPNVRGNGLANRNVRAHVSVVDEDK